MSQHFRTPQAGVPLQMPPGMLPNVSAGGAPVIYRTPHAPYNATAVTSVPGLAPPRAVYPPQMPSAQGNFGLVTNPAALPRVYVPVQRGGHPYVQPAVGGQMRVSDPTKLLEEQKKLEKERNFQLQQQRLKQFTVAGKKGMLNTDSLLESMFGKPDLKKSSKKANKSEGDACTSRVPSHTPVPMNTEAVAFTSLTKGDVAVKESTQTSKLKVHSDPKDLESMMMKCSNLAAPQKAKTFQKPMVREVPKVSQSGIMYSPSNKAANWSHVAGLGNIFTSPKPRFPTWCKSETVPQLYHEVAKLVTMEDSKSLDTARLYAIFSSSGLSQKVLADIWEMVNKTLPGSLTLEEMYAALSLIAVAQVGHPVTGTDILHRLPSCPVPVLKCFAQPQTVPLEAPSSDSSSVTPQTSSGSHRQAAGSGVQISTPFAASGSTRPTTLASVEQVASSVSTWRPFSSAGSVTSPADDDFDDFKSATPMAINAPVLPESATFAEFNANSDEFDDFKQADPPFEAFKPEKSEAVPITQEPGKHVNIEQNLMSTEEEDKYSVFRALQESSSESELKPEQKQNVSDSNFTSSSVKGGLFSAKKISSHSGSQDQDEFGEFLHASSASSTGIIPDHSESSSTFAANFADFSKLNNNEEQQLNKSGDTADAHCLEGTSSDSVAFGEFTACQFSSPGPDSAQDNVFTYIKDNISLAESQSISSLEFGVFDSIGHSGESKSSLSRQGSIPSLDLRGVGIEAGDGVCDDEFGDMQSAITTTSVSPTPSTDTVKSHEDRPSGVPAPLPQSMSAPLTDKYSVIRSDQVMDEDQPISSWVMCIQGCLDILQTAKKIFNQMSCSSVCSEVLSTEEGKNYVKNVIEVYRVVCRVSLASKSYEKQNNKLTELLEAADQAFHTLSVFLAGSPLMPSDESLDFSSGVLKTNPENNEKACGVCLLNVDCGSKAFNKPEDKNKLSYGGRQYHSPCANLWVNCVEPLLPMLTLPQLI